MVDLEARPCPAAAHIRRSLALRSLLIGGLPACLLVAPLVFRAPEGPAAREARRPHFVRRRASKPARALRSLRRPPHQWGWGAGVRLDPLSWYPAWPRRRPATRQVPPVRFMPATPISHVIPLRVFQDLNYIRWYFNVFGASRKMTTINYVRVFWGVCPWLRVGVAEFSRETAVAFARLCPCGVETLVAFARVGRASTETGVAFAGEKWVFLACFSVAEVLSVSKSPRRFVLCAKSFALLGLACA